MWEELGDWDWHMYTIDTCIKEINNEKTLGMHRELCLMLCVNLNLKKEQKGVLVEFSHTVKTMCLK